MNHVQLSPEMTPDSISIVTDRDQPRDRGTILLVEDEDFLLEVTCEILESAGYRVLKTRNAAEAISMFHRSEAIVRLLLTDVVLPGQNGLDLANELRRTSPDLRTIFISGQPGVLAFATLLVVASKAPCSAASAPVAIDSVPKRLDMADFLE